MGKTVFLETNQWYQAFQCQYSAGGTFFFSFFFYCISRHLVIPDLSSEAAHRAVTDGSKLRVGRVEHGHLWELQGIPHNVHWRKSFFTS